MVKNGKQCKNARNFKHSQKCSSRRISQEHPYKDWSYWRNPYGLCPIRFRRMKRFAGFAISLRVPWWFPARILALVEALALRFRLIRHCVFVLVRQYKGIGRSIWVPQMSLGSDKKAVHRERYRPHEEIHGRRYGSWWLQERPWLGAANLRAGIRRNYASRRPVVSRLDQQFQSMDGCRRSMP